MNKESEKEEIEKELREIVVARLNTISPNKKISIGSVGDFKKDELIEHIKKNDDIGRKIVEVELSFLRAQKEGLLYN